MMHWRAGVHAHGAKHMLQCCNSLSWAINYKAKCVLVVTIVQGTLLHRVEALERAMDTLLRAQDTALDAQRHRAGRAEAEGRGCCSCCCCIM